MSGGEQNLGEDNIRYDTILLSIRRPAASPPMRIMHASSALYQKAEFLNLQESAILTGWELGLFLLFSAVKVVFNA